MACRLGCAGLLALAGCGGGGDSGAAAPPSAGDASALSVSAVPSIASEEPEQAAPSVRIQGCVVDAEGAQRAGAQVRALSGNGRLLAFAQSDEQGLYTLLVPAQQSVAITLDGHGSDALWVLSGSHDTAIGSCLRDALR